MPRRPLSSISANIPRGKELTPYIRSKIVTLRENGAEIGEISKRLEISPNTIKKTITANARRVSGVTVHRKGRPKSYSTRDSGRVIQYVRAHPKATYADIQQNTGLTISYNTLNRILDLFGIKNWRAKQRPALEPQDVKVRLHWASVRMSWLNEWESVIFSDECSVERGKGGRRE